MDTGATSTASGTNPHLEALGALYRADNGGRKGAQQSQCRQARVVEPAITGDEERGLGIDVRSDGNQALVQVVVHSCNMHRSSPKSVDRKNNFGLRMSIFSKVIGERHVIESEKSRLEKARADAHENAKMQFKVAIIDAWETITMPVFDTFVSDAKAHGYDARLNVFGTSKSEYGGSIRLMAVHGEPLPSQRSDQVFVFEIGGEPYDQVVSLRSYTETETSNKENPLVTGGLEMMCKSFLEAELEKFLRSALERAALPATVVRHDVKKISLHPCLYPNIVLKDT